MIVKVDTKRVVTVIAETQEEIIALKKEFKSPLVVESIGVKKVIYDTAEEAQKEFIRLTQLFSNFIEGV